MNTVRIVPVVALLALTACAAPIQTVQQADRSMDSVKVLSIRHAEVEASVFNNPVRYLGLTAAIAASASDSSRAGALREHIGEFDVPAVFQHYLGEALQARGTTVEWSEPRVDFRPRRAEDEPRALRRDGFGLRRNYSSAAAGQSQLDLSIQFAGYASDGVGESNPYRPTVMVNVRLLDASGDRVLYQNGFHYNPINAGEGTITIPAAPAQSYPDFSDLRAEDPARLQAALQDALRAVAFRIVEEL